LLLQENPQWQIFFDGQRRSGRQAEVKVEISAASDRQEKQNFYADNLPILSDPSTREALVDQGGSQPPALASMPSERPWAVPLGAPQLDDGSL
jgi:hypothetical protein